MPAKRLSASGDAGTPKKIRRSTGDPNKAKLAAVTAALNSTDTLPDSVIDMLAGMAQHCLLTGKDERHGYQNSVIDMVSEALVGIETSLSQAVKDANTIVMGADGLKQQRDAALVTANSTVTALEVALVEKKSKLDIDKHAMVAAVAGLKEAETVQTQGDIDLAEASGKKGKIETMVTDAFNPSKEGGGDKKMLKEIEKMGNIFDMDKSLMEALQRALKKTAESRSHFDGIAVTEFDSACRKIVADLDVELKNGEPGKNEREAAVQAAAVQAAAACNLHEASSTAVSEAEASLKQSKVDVKTAEKGVHNFLSEIQTAANDLDKKQLALADFKESALASFAYLRDPPIPVEEPVAEIVGELVAQPTELPTVIEQAE